MQIVTITAVFEGSFTADTAAAATFEIAVQRINEKLTRAFRRKHGADSDWTNLNIPEGDASYIRSTSLGNIRFLIERHEV